MRGMRLLAVTLAIAALAQAQTYEIVGTVTEPGIGGIGGMPIYLSRSGAGSSPRPQTVTDARGAFRFALDRPGAYQVGPNGDGASAASLRGPYYQSPEARIGIIEIDAAHPRAEVSLKFLRWGQITGLVLDEETRQPVADFPINLVSVDANRGSSGNARSDANGRFTLNPVPAGEYVIRTRARQGQKRIDTSLPDPDPDALDSGYSDAYWPGDARDMKGALPVRVPSGGAMDVGTIVLHKVPQYKVRLSIPQGDCPEGESVRVSLFQNGAREPIMPPTGVRCGSDAVLRELDPGSYTLYAVSDWQGERDGADKAVWAN
jgi:hypothetical protein